MAQQNLRPWQSENTPSGQPQTAARPIALIVEPHAMWRLFLQAVLTLYQYSVSTATTEEEAEAAKQALDTSALGLVIVDLHLSDDLQARTGLELVERWQAADPTLTSILVSDHPNDAGLLTLDRSTVSFLAKPFLRQDVLEALARGMERTYLTYQSR